MFLFSITSLLSMARLRCSLVSNFDVSAGVRCRERIWLIRKRWLTSGLGYRYREIFELLEANSLHPIGKTATESVDHYKVLRTRN